MEAEKTFDCVRMMREVRDGINRDVETMTAEQRVEYIRRRAARVRQNPGLPEAVASRIHAAR